MLIDFQYEGLMPGPLRERNVRSKVGWLIAEVDFYMSNRDEIERRLKAIQEEPIPARLVVLTQRLQKALDDVDAKTALERT